MGLRSPAQLRAAPGAVVPGYRLGFPPGFREPKRISQSFVQGILDRPDSVERTQAQVIVNARSEDGRGAAQLLQAFERNLGNA